MTQKLDLEMTNKTSQSNKSSLLVSLNNVVKILTPILVALLGVYTTILTNKVQSLKDDLENSRAFPMIVKELYPSLVRDEQEASISIAGLYALAGKNKEHKRIIITIAAVTSNDKVLQVLDALIKGDREAEEIAKSPEIINLLASFNIQEAKMKTMVNDLHKQNQPLPIDQLPPTGPRTDILINISAADGWAYIGKTDADKDVLKADITIDSDSKKVPQENSIVTMSTNTNLRDSQPKGNELGKIIGVIKKGKEVTIKDIIRKPINKGTERAIWAKIEIKNE